MLTMTKTGQRILYSKALDSFLIVLLAIHSIHKFTHLFKNFVFLPRLKKQMFKSKLEYLRAESSLN